MKKENLIIRHFLAVSMLILFGFNENIVSQVSYSGDVYYNDYLLSRSKNTDSADLVVLPFDISENSSTQRLDVKTLPGFTAYKLGSSYADGGAKFESKNAGSATLTAHLDGKPDSIFFELQGYMSSQDYSGITFVVSQSEDGDEWQEVAVLDETDISVSGYSVFGGYKLDSETRYIRWQLLSAASGNTKLNNIRITKHDTIPDDVGIDRHSLYDEYSICPNPAGATFGIISPYNADEVLLYDLRGNLVRKWSDITCGASLYIGDLHHGSYVVVVKRGGGVLFRKLLLKS